MSRIEKPMLFSWLATQTPRNKFLETIFENIYS